MIGIFGELVFFSTVVGNIAEGSGELVIGGGF
jgi:hypothetical protein